MLPKREPLSISLIIPAYNEEKYIAACLESVSKNSNGIFKEVIVVDNNCTDTTRSIAESFPDVQVVSELEKGLTKARQRGLMVATGDVLAYIDADTRMPPGWAKKVRKAFEDNEKLACMSGPYQYYDIPVFNQYLVWLWYKFAMPLYFFLGYMATGGNFAIRKAVVLQMGGFDENIAFYGEDTDIARRAHAFGKVIFTSKITMPTSGRRFKEEGFVSVAYAYLINFFAIVFTGKPVSSAYSDIR